MVIWFPELKKSDRGLKDIGQLSPPQGAVLGKLKSSVQTGGRKGVCSKTLASKRTESWELALPAKRPK